MTLDERAEQFSVEVKSTPESALIPDRRHDSFKPLGVCRLPGLQRRGERHLEEKRGGASVKRPT